jgi:hypothetical protein
MTAKSVSLRVQNGLLYIRDADSKDDPKIDGIGAYWWTPSCVAVGCQPDSEGSTRLTLGRAGDLRAAGDPIFDRRLLTPSRSVVVETVLGEKILQQDVDAAETRVRIWTDGHVATEFVVIELG